MNNNLKKIFRKIESDIISHGASIILTAIEVDSDMVNFAYTVGLDDQDLPELMFFGLPQDSTIAIVNTAIKLIINDKLELDENITKILNVPVVFKLVSPEAASNYIYLANRRSQSPIAAWQMFWPDQFGFFPWETEFDKQLAQLQPLLYELDE
jgi:hypothetical protein